MDKPRPPARPPATPAPAHNPDNCRKCGRPIDLKVTIWIPIGVGVAAGVEHDRCSP